MELKKLITLTIILLAGLTLFTGCAQEEQDPDEQTNNAQSNTAPSSTAPLDYSNTIVSDKEINNLAINV